MSYLSNPSSIVQIGMIVCDIEKSTKAYADFFGVDVPQIVMTDTVDKTKMTFNGKRALGRTKQAFFQVGQLTIELLEPDQEASAWRQHLSENGEGFHHIAFLVEDMENEINRLEEKRLDVVQRGLTSSGGQYAYVDTRDSLRLWVELLEPGKRTERKGEGL
ncbi:VOC family protein [Halalkalibacter oceani]|uniref:VOC family protein n=1 Tax=Halalkalibacter oceani TaxID=1653776 RepID=UPI003394EDDC